MFKILNCRTGRTECSKSQEMKMYDRFRIVDRAVLKVFGDKVARSESSGVFC